MISFEHVSKTYPNGVKGLKDINLTIGDGEFVSIIGLSGAGKSTLLRAVNRLIDITEGEITVNGVSVTKAGKKQLREIRRHIGMISQNFNLVKRSTVQKNVLSGRLGYYSTIKSILGLFSKEDYERTREALESVGLLDRLHTRSDELSGGQQQRVSIARTLVQQADVILADEPVASLDPITSRKILSDLQKINREMGKTILVNIHSVEMAKAFSTRIIAMKSGEVVFDGTQTFFYRATNNRSTMPVILNKIADSTQAMLTPKLTSECSLNSALKMMNNYIKERASVFVISSFNMLGESEKKSLSQLSKKSRVFGVNVFDPLEKTAPIKGEYMVADGKGKNLIFNSANKLFRAEYQQYFDDKKNKFQDFCRRFRIAYAEICPAQDLCSQLKFY